jgi:hypothetical protein
MANRNGSKPNAQRGVDEASLQEAWRYLSGAIDLLHPYPDKSRLGPGPCSAGVLLVQRAIELSSHHSDEEYVVAVRAAQEVLELGAFDDAGDGLSASVSRMLHGVLLGAAQSLEQATAENAPPGLKIAA